MSGRTSALAAVVLGGCGLAACASPPSGERPALLDDDPASAAVLALTLQQIFGRPVSLAPDAFTKDSSMTLEPVPARVDGVRIDGRETRAPERFTLLRSAGKCVLRRESSGDRHELAGAGCHPH